MSKLTPAVRIACLPDTIRGFEDIKLASIEGYRDSLSLRVSMWRR